MADRLRIRSADDPQNPEAMVIERFETLRLKPQRFSTDDPWGWVVIAWHPSREAATVAAEQQRVRASASAEQADVLLAQIGGIEPPPESESERPDFSAVVWRWYGALGTDARAAIDRSVGPVGMVKLVDMLHDESDRADDALVPTVADRLAKTLGEQWKAVVDRVTVERPRS